MVNGFDLVQSWETMQNFPLSHGLIMSVEFDISIMHLFMHTRRGKILIMIR
jgi:hypothetical protein